MGETNFQRKIFTVMMCFGMVLGMTAYNIILHQGFSLQVFPLLVKQLWLVFIVAFILDFFVVGPFVKKQVFSRVTPKTKKVKIFLSIAISMVTSMVLLMSIFGSVFMEGFTIAALKIYPKNVFMNFIAALPLNLLIVAPLVRSIFPKIFPTSIVN